MLVISRKPGERVCVGDDVIVTVLEVTGSTVRLGIEAPDDVRIYRHEIWEAVKRENQAAADTSVTSLPTTNDGIANGS
jgi:carbon storage regulator